MLPATGTRERAFKQFKNPVLNVLKYPLGDKEIILSSRDFHTIKQHTSNQEGVEIRHKLVNVHYL